MSNALNPPDAPPAHPVIPEGLATKMGKYGTLLLALVAAVVPFLPDTEGSDAKTYAALATAVGIATILGRMLQAAAALRGAPTPNDAPIDAFEDLPDEPPSEDKLRNGFPDEPPVDPMPDDLMPEGGIGGKPRGAV